MTLRLEELVSILDAFCKINTGCLSFLVRSLLLCFELSARLRLLDSGLARSRFVDNRRFLGVLAITCNPNWRNGNIRLGLVLLRMHHKVSLTIARAVLWYLALLGYRVMGPSRERA